MKTYDREPGQLMISGMVTWELTGRKNNNKISKIRPNLYLFNRFTEDKVRIYHLLLINRNFLNNTIFFIYNFNCFISVSFNCQWM